MTARIILALVLIFAAACYLAWRLIGTGKGQHAAPRGFTAADERLVHVHHGMIVPARTEADPPWEPAPVPGRPDAYVIATATVSGGRLHSIHAAVLPPLPPWPAALPEPVRRVLGHDSVDDALDSIFTRAMTGQVRALTDGRP